jgi:serine/threonine-protein kinase RsbW
MNQSFFSDEFYQIPAALENGAIVRSLVEHFSTKTGLSESQVSNLQLAVCEAFNNAVEHGLDLDDKQTVVLRLRTSHRKLLIEIEDYGKGVDFHGFGFSGCFPQAGERGRGLQIIAALTDGIEFENLFPSGTRIILMKWLNTKA